MATSILVFALAAGSSLAANPSRLQHQLHGMQDRHMMNVNPSRSGHLNHGMSNAAKEDLASADIERMLKRAKHLGASLGDTGPIEEYTGFDDRKVFLWTYFNLKRDVSEHLAILDQYNASFTHLAPISHLIDLDGTFEQFDEGYPEQFWDTLLPELSSKYVVVPTVSLPPGYKGDGVTALLESEELQTKFVNDSVQLAVDKGYPSLNMDIENSGGHTCEDFSGFLTKMADAMHDAGKELSVDFDGGFLNEDCLAQSNVDLLGDMNTYGAFNVDFFESTAQNGAERALSSDRYCVGLWGDNSGYNAELVTERLEKIKELGIRNICIWEDEIWDMEPAMWTELQKFLEGN